MALCFSALKVLVVSDIKRDLGYKGSAGHKSWRNICNRLKEARVVEEFLAKVDGKVSEKRKAHITVKYRKQQQHHIDIGKLPACLSPSGFDSREPYDLPFGPIMFNNSQEALLRRKLEKEAVLQKAIDLHSSSSSPVIPVSCQSNSQSPNYQVTEENSSHEASSAGQENKSGSEDSGKKQRCNSPELHKRGLEHILLGKIVAAASPMKSTAENLPTGTDDSFSPTPASTSTIEYP
nr:zinc finger CCCH domain-containing protein 22-like isoform X1 [Ipomoea batatas]GMD01242.1 zinc finger CCCH domain-containing protein 22-like isoform X1 [Ipomoea batatas]